MLRCIHCEFVKAIHPQTPATQRLTENCEDCKKINWKKVEEKEEEEGKA